MESTVYPGPYIPGVYPWSVINSCCTTTGLCAHDVVQSFFATNCLESKRVHDVSCLTNDGKYPRKWCGNGGINAEHILFWPSQWPSSLASQNRFHKNSVEKPKHYKFTHLLQSEYRDDREIGWNRHKCGVVGHGSGSVTRDDTQSAYNFIHKSNGLDMLHWSVITPSYIAPDDSHPANLF